MIEAQANGSGAGGAALVGNPALDSSQSGVRSNTVWTTLQAHYRWLLLVLPAYSVILNDAAAWSLTVVLAAAVISYNGMVSYAAKRWKGWVASRSLYLLCIEIGLICIGLSLLYIRDTSLSSYRFYYDGFYAVFVGLAAASAGRKGTLWSTLVAMAAVAVGQVMLAPATPALFTSSGLEYWIAVCVYTLTLGLFFLAIGLLTDLSVDFRSDAGPPRSLVQLAQQFEILRDAVLILDDRGRIANANPAASEIFRRRAKELRGLELRQLIQFASDDSQGFDPIVTPGRARRPLLASGILPSGKLVPVELTMSRYRFNGRPSGATVAVIRDLSDRQRIVELATQRERLATVGEVMARVMHELATPLTGIATLVDELMATSSPLHQSDLRMVREESARASGMIHDVLSFVRRDNRTKPVDVNEAVMRALKISKLRNDGDDACIELDLSSDPIFATATAGRLQQLVFNLVENARHAIEGRPEGKVTVRTRRIEDRIRIEIIDNGVGIEESIRDQIFEPFFTTKEPGVGTGLGLAIVKSIVAEFGGDLSVASEDVGATFTLDLEAAVPTGDTRPHSLSAAG